MRKILLILLVMGITFVGCYDNVDDFKPYPADQVKYRLLFVVKNQENKPVPEVKISIDDHTFTTDKMGIFYSENTLLKKGQNEIYLEKAGYFTHSKVVNFNKQTGSKIIRMDIKELDKGNTSHTDDIATLQSGDIEMTIPSHAFANEDGTLYEGEYTIYINEIEPDREALFKSIIGTWEGKRKNDGIVALENFGQLQFYAEGVNGKSLQLAEGVKLKINYTIDPPLQQQLNNPLPLWAYNRDVGSWEEKTIGEVSNGLVKFSIGSVDSWMVATAFPPVEIKGKVRSEYNFQMATEYINIVNINGSNHSIDLDYDGSFSATLPQNEDLTLRLMDRCGEIIGESDIGKFPVETVIPTLRYDYKPEHKIKVRTTDCYNNPIAAGYFIVQWNNRSIAFMSAKSEIVSRFNYCEPPQEGNTTLSYYNEKGKHSEILLSPTMDINYGSINSCDRLFSTLGFIVRNDRKYEYSDLSIENTADKVEIQGNLPEGNLTIALKKGTDKVVIIEGPFDVSQITNSQSLIDKNNSSVFSATFTLEYEKNGSENSLYGRVLIQK